MMWIVWILVAVVAIVAGITVLGLVSSAQQRKNAPARLAQATKAFEAGETNEALVAISKALWVPADGKYEAADARTAHEVVCLLDRALQQMGAGPRDQVASLRAALEKAAAGGGEVPSALTEPVEAFVSRLSSSTGIAEALMDAARSGQVDAEDSGDGSASTPEQAELIHKVGRLLMRGKADDAIAVLDGALGAASGDLRADLLNQRGGCFAMKSDWERARLDYEACIALQPSRSVHHFNLGEMLEKLGRKDEARAAVTKAAELARGRRDREDAEKMLRRLA